MAGIVVWPVVCYYSLIFISCFDMPTVTSLKQRRKQLLALAWRLRTFSLAMANQLAQLNTLVKGLYMAVLYGCGLIFYASSKIISEFGSIWHAIVF